MCHHYYGGFPVFNLFSVFGIHNKLDIESCFSLKTLSFVMHGMSKS